tara:strand:- start:3473 stop:3721 length:249 start_codon:yes stop_codon:yes gene_type:complete
MNVTLENTIPIITRKDLKPGAIYSIYPGSEDRFMVLDMNCMTINTGLSRATHVSVDLGTHKIMHSTNPDMEVCYHGNSKFTW